MKQDKHVQGAYSTQNCVSTLNLLGSAIGYRLAYKLLFCKLINAKDSTGHNVRIFLFYYMDLKNTALVSIVLPQCCFFFLPVNYNRLIT